MGTGRMFCQMRKIRFLLGEIPWYNQKTMNVEIWKDIENYQNLYEVSNLGRVRSLKFGKTKILTPVKNNKGYLLVKLYKDRKVKRFLVHRLVAQAFIANPLKLPFCNHIDENPLNNRVDNLEFCTPAYNVRYGTCQARRAAKLSKPVCQYDKQGNFLRQWASMMEIKRQLGYNPGAICLCCLGKRELAYGFAWRYAR